MRPFGKIDRLLASLALLLTLSGAAWAAPIKTDTIRLRFYWGGEASHGWEGRITAAGGRIDQLGLLGTGPHAAAIITEASGELKIRRGPQARHYACDATLTLGEAKQLRVELTPDEGETQAFEIPIDQLITGAYSANFTGDGGRLVVSRLIEDQLRIDTGRDSLILAPGETLSLKVAAALADVDPLTPIDLQVELVRGRMGEVVTQQSHRVEFPVEGPETLQTNLTLPTEEGVYSVHVRAIRPSGFTTVFRPRSSGKVLVERNFQVLVFDRQQRRQLASEGALLAEIDPTTPRWWERMPRWVWPRRLSRPNQPIGSLPPVVVGSEQQPFVELPMASEQDHLADPLSAKTGHWHAYQLPVAKGGVPHLVEIEYPIDKPQTLTVSILDRHALGQIVPLGSSEEVFVNDWQTLAESRTRGEPRPTRLVRRLFWPTTREPLLLISNHGDSTAQFGKIRVRQLKSESAAVVDTLADSDQPQDQATVDQRLLLCLTNPRLSDVFGASQAPTKDRSFSVDDWQTWFETATRLADLVELGGYNGAAVTVASSQGLIYPSTLLANSPGTDRGPLADGTVDLPAKDLLELLLLEFDRRGLQLTPVITYDAAIPVLEAARIARKSTTEPLYNPLRPDVSATMRAVIAEIRDNYGSHPALTGIAVNVGAGREHDYGLLAASTAGQTIDQVNAFLRANELEWPPQVPRNAETTSLALSGPWREAWIRWRQEQMASVYQLLAAELEPSTPKQDLWLMTHQLTDRPAIGRALQPSLDNETTLASAYALAGIDTQNLATQGSVRVASSHPTVGGRALSESSVNHRINRLRRNGETARGNAPTIVARRVSKRRLAAPLANDRLTAPMPELMAINTPSNAAQNYAELLATQADGPLLEGGQSAPLLLDESANRLREYLRTREREAASNDGDETSSGWQTASQQPLLVRWKTTRNGTTVEVINPLPWAVDARLTVESAASCQGQWASEDPERFAAGKHVLPRTMRPFSVSPCKFDSEQVQVTGVRSILPPVAKQAIADRLNDLKRRDLSVASPYRPAVNLSFEQLNQQGLLVGWEAIANGGALRLSEVDPKQGNQSLVVQSTSDGEGPVILTTRSMPAPETGQLAVTFHLRPESVSADSRVVVRIEQVDGDYSSSTTLAAERLGGEQLQLPGGQKLPADWRRPYAFAAADLPIGTDKPIRLVFEFSGQSTIAIDDLQLYDLVFPLDLGDQSTRQKLALVKIIREAESAFERGELAECHHLLDGYWPRFLQAYTPLLPETVPETVTEAASETATPDANSEEQEPAEVSNGWRSYLPRFWR